MRGELIKAFEYGELMDMMYIAQDGTISRRRIKVLKVGDVLFRAHCFLRGSKRTFIIDNILALNRVEYKEELVI
jgi:predicted DNA-binding transcriptional regulator YafY